MTNLEIIEFIDEFLRKQEDVLHGTEGIDCTKSRKYLDMIKKQLPIHGVVKPFYCQNTEKGYKDSVCKEQCLICIWQEKEKQ